MWKRGKDSSRGMNKRAEISLEDWENTGIRTYEKKQILQNG